MPATQYLMMAEPIKVNLSPLAFHRWARHYLVAAKAVPQNQGFTPAPYFLLGVSAELGLKAFLLAKGATRQSLKKKFGHNVQRLLKAAETKGLGALLSVSPEQRVQIQRLRTYYTTRDLEYFPLEKALKGFSGLPDLAAVTAFVEQLLASTEQLCKAVA
jgi:HEPN domain-containing protein